MCQLCARKHDEDACFPFNRERRLLLAEGPWIQLKCGVDDEDHIFLIACGEDYTERYYPKFCPECGRQLQRREYGAEKT